jgi:hypothetical protein
VKSTTVAKLPVCCNHDSVTSVNKSSSCCAIPCSACVESCDECQLCSLGCAECCDPNAK